jgi:phage N-6-adenine-methyltransferase
VSALALRTDSGVALNDNVAAGLPALVRKAADQLASATTAAEVLEARDAATFAYDAAKAAARYAKAQGAYDEVLSKIYRAQADALEIEVHAKRRIADEYDAMQAAVLVATNRDAWKTEAWERGTGLVTDRDKTPTVVDLGLTRQEIHRAREVREWEDKSPGIVKESLDAIVDRGHIPSKAELSREINTRLASFSGDNEWYTPARYVDMAREVMGAIDTDPASNPTAQRTVRAATYYTEETNGLDKDWHGKVWMNPPYSNPEVQQFAEKVIAEYRAGRVTEAIVLTNNSADTGWHRAMQDACTRMCTTTGRIRFESPTRQGNSPAMGQSFFYFGDNPEKFKEVFSAIGNVWRLA